MNFKFTKPLLAIALMLISTVAWSQSQTPLDIALRHIEQNYKSWDLTQSDISDMVVSDLYQSKKSGLTHIYFNQRHEGIVLQNAILNANVSLDGEVIYVGKRFQPDLKSLVTNTAPVLNADEALQVVFDDLGITAQLPRSNQGDTEYKFKYLKEDLARWDIPVQLTYKKMDTGIELVWNVMIDALGNIDMWDFNIDAITGQIVEKRDMLVHCSFKDDAYHNHDAHCRAENLAQKKEVPVKEAISQSNTSVVAGSYRVFAVPSESPAHGDHVIVTDPHDISASPFGWHDTTGDEDADFTITRGNNVWAYPDRDGDGNSSNDEPDGGMGLLFDFPYTLDGEAEENTDAATVNLFYMNNIIHDFTHAYGFDEAAGNFQFNNLGNGGQGGDHVLARAQQGADAGQVDNANFATPPDGGNGVMNMYVWNAPTSNFTVEEPSPVAGQYTAIDAQFGAAITTTPVTGEVIEVNDGVATPFITDGCQDYLDPAALDGKIALIDRGGCQFGTKCVRAQEAGAIAVIVCNVPEADAPGSTGDDPIAMGGGNDGASVTIPALMIGKSDCDEIRVFAGNGLIATFVVPTNTGPDFLDGDFDNGIIAHEFGHGVSIRLTGGPNNSGCVGNGESMGEGWSDFFSLVTTVKPGDSGEMRRGVGTYVLRQDNDGKGIRDYPYTTDMNINPFTYGAIPSLNNASPHDRGTVWCTILWDMYWAFVDEYGFDEDLVHGTGGNNMAVQLVMDGMKIQPCGPGFTDGRDAILAADQALYNGDNQCLIWEVFARRGCGYSADQGDPDSFSDQTEAFDPLPTCIQELKISKAVTPLINAGDEIDVNISVINHKPETLTGVTITDQLEPGMDYVPGSISLPAGDAAVTVGASSITIDLGDMEYLAEIDLTYKISTDPGNFSIRHYYEDMENVDPTFWFPFPILGENFWTLTEVDAYSGTTSYFVENTEAETEQQLQGANPPVSSISVDGTNPVLRIFHNYNTEPAADGGIIQVSKDGMNWEYIDDKLFRNPYSGIQYTTFAIPGLTAFSGNSEGWIASYADLSDWAGEEIAIRFYFASDDNTAPTTTPAGWFIDDLEIMDIIIYDTEACVTSDQGDQACASAPDRGTIVESQEPVSTIDPIENVFVKIFPNPTDEMINLAISSLEHEEVRISLVTLEGREVLSTSVETSNMTQTFNLDVSSLPGGFYFVKVATDNGLKVEKVVIH